ncbi:MAG: hypothetical protein ACP5NK_07015 [Thermoplasmata archaeon]
MLFEYLTGSPSQIPVLRIMSVQYGPIGSSNSTFTSPQVFNESGNGFSVEFEILPGPTLVIQPGYSTYVWFGNAAINETVSSPYTGVTFHIIGSSYTIGNYTMYSPDFHHMDNSPMLFLMYKIGPAITSYDQEGHNYSGNGTIDIVPVIYSGPFHFAQSPQAINFKTPYPWYYIQHVFVT